MKCASFASFIHFLRCRTRIPPRKIGRTDLKNLPHFGTQCKQLRFHAATNKMATTTPIAVNHLQTKPEWFPTWIPTAAMNFEGRVNLFLSHEQMAQCGRDFPYFGDGWLMMCLGDIDGYVNNVDNFIEKPGYHIYLRQFEANTWIEIAIWGTGEHIGTEEEVPQQDFPHCCLHCGSPKATKFCKNCRSAYCNKKCQRSAWKARKCKCQ